MGTVSIDPGDVEFVAANQKHIMQPSRVIKTPLHPTFIQ